MSNRLTDDELKLMDQDSNLDLCACFGASQAKIDFATGRVWIDESPITQGAGVGRYLTDVEIVVFLDFIEVLR